MCVWFWHVAAGCARPAFVPYAFDSGTPLHSVLDLPAPGAFRRPFRRSHSVGPAATGRRSRGASSLTQRLAALFVARGPWPWTGADLQGDSRRRRPALSTVLET